jgi:hypothetical protein
MKKLLSLSVGKLLSGAAVALAAVWRLGDVIDIPANAAALGALRIVLFAAFFMLTVSALAKPDRRLARVSWPVGALIALFLVLGKPMNERRALPEATAANVLGMVVAILAYAAVFGAAAYWLYRGVLRYTRAADVKPADEKESRFSRLTGNGFFTFAVLLLCWAPVWLAFYPGTFRYDAATQFSTYVDGVMTTHHPLLHTLLMGWLMDAGNELSSLTLGVALYSGVQMVLTSAILGYACAWLRTRRAPLGLRTAVLALFALYPLYPLWSFSATKDVLFGAFVLLTCLQTADLWRDGRNWFRSPVRVCLYVLTVILMMLLRNNGVYAFCLMLPFGVIAAKSRRVRTAALLLICVAGFLGANRLLVSAVEAEGGSYVEILSIPLQQVLRTAAQGELTGEDEALLEELYWQFDGAPGDAYAPMCADSAKWNLDEDVLTDDWQSYLSLWRREGLRNPKLFLEAFLEQNLPYYYPGAKMNYNIVLGLLPMDLYELEERPVLPALRPFYEAYDDTLTVAGIPGSGLLSDNAVMVWLTLWLLGLAIYRRQQGVVIAAVFLLAVWCTCLMGPIAVMRYMLGFFYTVPVLFAFAFARGGENAKASGRIGG